MQSFFTNVVSAGEKTTTTSVHVQELCMRYTYKYATARNDFGRSYSLGRRVLHYINTRTPFIEPYVYTWYTSRGFHRICVLSC